MILRDLIKSFSGNIYKTDILLLFFVALLFATFFYLSNGQLYVLDNNETYSSLWHAYNFINFDFEHHKGLTDETFSYLDSSHSFVHTHQGNFPRILSIILIAFGFNSAEAHILLTFLIIGLPTYFFAHKVLITFTNSKKFSIFSLFFLTTNYILFFQWLFVTYRIWYFYLIFTTIFFLINYDKSRVYKILLFLNLIFVSYFELIFAAFFFIFLFLYICLAHKFSIRLILKKYFYLIFAPIITLSILSFQLINFYGLESFIRDITYTFLSRNTTQDNFLNLIDFFKNNNIVFWHNFLNRGKENIIENFFYNDFKYYGNPILMLILYSFAVPLFKTKSNLFFFLSNRILFNNYLGKILFISLFFINNYLMIKILQINNSNIFFLNTFFILSLIIFIYSNNFFVGTLRDEIIFQKFFIFLCTSTIYLHNIYFSTHIDNKLIYDNSSLLLLFNIFFIFIAKSSPLKKNILILNKNFFFFISSFLMSFIIISLISGGYIWSGYISRAAPFLIFIKFIIYSVSLFYLFYLFITNVKNKNFFLQFSSIGLLSSFIFLWFYLQIISIYGFGINNYDFLNRLKNDKFYNSSFVSNIYPASYTYVSKSWGYHDDSLVKSQLKYKDNKYFLKVNNKYLWFKDSNNLIYKKPKFILCYSDNFSCNDFILIKNTYDFVSIIDSKIINANIKWVILELDYSKNFGGLVFE